ncbi:hypothetical protein FQN50_004633 [Emmonsiellopsis sp. PD_5]|nr:hypothetical protein FQN50_004633 [Emmonsiellopsis sp. PD_5]
MASEALNVIEVLETILLCLPTKDLLLSQRVCKKWKDVIFGSIKLQQELFVYPIEPRPFTSRSDSPQTGKELGGQYRVNALLCDIVFENWEIFYHDKIGHLTMSCNLRNASSEMEKATGNNSASWQRMYLSQPPATVVICYEHESHESFPGCDRPDAMFRNSDGVKMVGIVGWKYSVQVAQGEDYAAEDSDDQDQDENDDGDEDQGQGGVGHDEKLDGEEDDDGECSPTEAVFTQSLVRYMFQQMLHQHAKEV